MGQAGCQAIRSTIHVLLPRSSSSFVQGIFSNSPSLINTSPQNQALQHIFTTLSASHIKCFSIMESSRTGLLSLPQELRDSIWRLALPRNRILRVKFDFQNCNARVIGPFSRVPTILHVCQDSRQLALGLLQKGFESKIPLEAVRANNFYWCPEFDRLYIVDCRSWTAMYEPNYEIAHEPESPKALLDYQHFKQVFPTVQHIAFPLISRMVTGFHTEMPPNRRFWLYKLLCNVPSLKSVYMLVAPHRDWLAEGPETADAKQLPTVVTAFEPLDVELRAITFSSSRHMRISAYHKRPVVIEQDMQSDCEVYRQDAVESEAQDWCPPSFHVMVLRQRRFKNSSFCLPSRRNLEPWIID